MKRMFALISTAGVLAGCSTLNINADVSSYSRWPSGRGAATYAFERLPSQQAEPQQAQVLEDAARRAIEGAGFAAAAEGKTPDVTIQLGARVTETYGSPFDDPLWYGGYGAWRPFGYGRFFSAYGYPGWRTSFWGPTNTFPSYAREVGVLIRDKRSGEPLYEARAQSGGLTPGVDAVLPAMFAAALRDFPNGSASNPHRVTVEALR